MLGIWPRVPPTKICPKPLGKFLTWADKFREGIALLAQAPLLIKEAAAVIPELFNKFSGEAASDEAGRSNYCALYLWTCPAYCY